MCDRRGVGGEMGAVGEEGRSRWWRKDDYTSSGGRYEVADDEEDVWDRSSFDFSDTLCNVINALRED